MPLVSLSISMNMDVRGEESSHRVAFVHGVGFHLERWDGVIRRLGPGVRSLRIVHVIGPEGGISQPGLLIVCCDSHTSTHGAVGALAFGIGMSEVAHVLATQTLWQRKPKTMPISVEGRLGPHVVAKDIILAIIAKIGTAGGTGHVVEYAGSAIRALTMEGRLTFCNMSIEAGARAGMVAPDWGFTLVDGAPCGCSSSSTSSARIHPVHPGPPRSAVRIRRDRREPRGRLFRFALRYSAHAGDRTDASDRRATDAFCA